MLAIFLAASARAESANDIVKKVRKKYDQLTTMRIDFEQSYHWVLADQTNTIRGSFFLAKGNKYRVILPNQVIVSDGKTVWTYSESLHQVMIDRLSEEVGNPVPGELLLKYSRDFDARLLGEEKVDDTNTYVLELTPKSEDEFVRKVGVWVDKDRWTVVRLRQEDLNGNVTVYVVTQLLEDPKLPAKLFTFEIPADAEVVDMR
jgi:outer membrane lipoprotein-sorting protein